MRKTFLLILLLSVAWDWTEEGGRPSLCDGGLTDPNAGLCPQLHPHQHSPSSQQPAEWTLLISHEVLEAHGFC